MLKIRKVHRFSALILFSFVAMHLVNHLFALGGAEQHIAFMQTLRAIYRNPVIEFILLVAAGIQVVTGLTLFWKLRRASGNRLAKIQRYSGLFLAFFIVSHVGAALFTRFVQNLDTNFYWAASVLVARPYVYYYAPYYGLGVIAFGAHIALGLRPFLARRWSRQRVQRFAYGVMLTSIVLAAVLLMAFGAVFYPIVLPQPFVLP